MLGQQARLRSALQPSMFLQTQTSQRQGSWEPLFLLDQSVCPSLAMSSTFRGTNGTKLSVAGPRSTVRIASLHQVLQPIRFVGDIVYLDLMGMPMLVLNSLDAIRELTEKRMNIHSGRPHTTFVGDM